jgi:nucleotide-binding universal stress UspA family protein
MTLTHILVPTDFTPAAREALALAQSLAQRFDAKLTLLHVAVPPALEGVPEVHWRHEDWLEQLEDQLSELRAESQRCHARTQSLLVTGDVCEQILSAADMLAVDMVVMGTRNRSPLAHIWSASIAARMIRSARVPVVTVQAMRRASDARAA